VARRNCFLAHASTPVTRRRSGKPRLAAIRS
jgi:hypothetical protein